MLCVKVGRMEKVGLNITPKEFKQLSKWSENIYNTAVVIDYFVANQRLKNVIILRQLLNTCETMRMF